MFPERLKTIRIQRSLTRSQLASLLGVTENAVVKWELGMREPKYEMLVKICDALDVTSDYLLGRTPDPMPASDGARPSVSTVAPIPEGQDNNDEDPQD